MIAPETTLGADCGIGMACALELLSGDDSTGRIEALFTVSEETGLDGAMALKPGFFSGKTLINLDSEDEGQIFVGCAGGLDTTAKFAYTEEPVPDGCESLQVVIDGLLGGHSGDDINRGRANAVQLLAGFLYDTMKYGLTLLNIDGGNKRNAIARHACAEIAVPAGNVRAVARYATKFRKACMEEYGATDPGLKVKLVRKGAATGKAICKDTADRLVRALTACPHGVLAMSMEIENFVETSTNLASVKMTAPGVIRIGTSQRSCKTSARRAAGRKVESCFLQAGASVAHENEYPGWTPARDSAIRDLCVASYKRLFNTDPQVLAIHAGLECGLFTETCPGLDMISVGPTLRGVHAPGERLELASLDKFTALLTDIVVNFGK